MTGQNVQKMPIYAQEKTTGRIFEFFTTLPVDFRTARHKWVKRNIKQNLKEGYFLGSIPSKYP